MCRRCTRASGSFLRTFVDDIEQLRDPRACAPAGHGPAAGRARSSRPRGRRRGGDPRHPHRGDRADRGAARGARRGRRGRGATGGGLAGARTGGRVDRHVRRRALHDGRRVGGRRRWCSPRACRAGAPRRSPRPAACCGASRCSAPTGSCSWPRCPPSCCGRAGHERAGDPHGDRGRRRSREPSWCRCGRSGSGGPPVCGRRATSTWCSTSIGPIGRSSSSTSPRGRWPSGRPRRSGSPTSGGTRSWRIVAGGLAAAALAGLVGPVVGRGRADLAAVHDLGAAGRRRARTVDTDRTPRARTCRRRRPSSSSRS